MNIEAYIITWNREDIIHLTINHYKQFCSKVTIFDNFSDDRTREIAEWMDCEVKLFGKAGVLDDGEYLKIKNNCWKGSNADWVIVCDDDEIISPPNLDTASILKTQGYEMYSNDVPSETFFEVNTGIKADNYSKLVMFDPKRVKEIGYIYGCHEARPKGDIVYSDKVYPLYHYRSIGGPDRLINRFKSYRPRLSPLNKKWNLGHHYLPIERETEQQWEDRNRREWEDSYAKSEILF